MKIVMEVLVEVPEGTTEDDLRTVFHRSMGLLIEASTHYKLDHNLLARHLRDKRERLTMREAPPE